MDDGSRLPLEEGHVKKKSGIFDKLTHIFHGKQQDAVTEKEIISMVDEAHEKGVLHKDEAEMIQNIFAFEDKEVGAVMTHRSHVAAFALEDLLKDVVEHMMERYGRSQVLKWKFCVWNSPDNPRINYSALQRENYYRLY